jgi:hypothetical protein
MGSPSYPKLGCTPMNTFPYLQAQHNVSAWAVLRSKNGHGLCLLLVCMAASQSVIGSGCISDKCMTAVSLTACPT